MFSKRNLLALFAFSAVSGYTAVFAQQTPPPPPPAQPRIERQMQVFNTAAGGSYLGVQLQEVTKENFSKFGLREVRGAAVEKVMENSPAAQAGLQNGDVIVRFEGEEVTSVRKLMRLISEVAPDHQAKLTVLRAGKEREINATIGKRATPQFRESALEQLYGLPGIPEFPRVPSVPSLPPLQQVRPLPPGGENQDFLMLRGDYRQIGAAVSPLGKQLGDYFGVADGRGLLVNNVRENSPAAKSGLKAGDVIIEVEGKAVAKMFDLTRAVNEKKDGDVNLTIIRNKNRQIVRVTPEKITGGDGFTMEYFDGMGNGNPNQPMRQFRLMQPPQSAPLPPRLPPPIAPRIL